MKYENMIISKVPRPSRSFQMGILRHIECQFQELAQTVCPDPRQARQHICRSKTLLLDIRHIILYQSFDYDVRDKMMIRADAIVNFINSFMSSLNKQQSYLDTKALKSAHGQ